MFDKHTLTMIAITIVLGAILVVIDRIVKKIKEKARRKDNKTYCMWWQ